MSNSINQIKDLFPLLANSNIIYLDNAATTQKPRKVIEAINQYYFSQNANIHRGAYDLAMIATRVYENTRTSLADFINAPSAKEIIFTSGTTASVNLVATSFARPRLTPGSNIVVSQLEHHSNFVPWQMVCEEKGAELRWIPITQKGDLDLSNLHKLIDEHTVIVSVNHISNSLGTINPIRKIIEFAHKKGAPVFIDGAQSTGHQPINIQELDCDFFGFSGHKMYGPTGIGGLFGKEKYLNEMPPYQFGGEMIRMVTLEKTTFNVLPHKFEAGTPNIAGVAGLGAAIEFLRQTGMEKIQQHVDHLGEYARKRLSEIEGITLFGEAEHRAGIVSFTYNRVHPHDLSTVFNESGIAIRAGHHCTQPVMMYYGIPGTVRASFAIYNTKEDIDHLIKAFDQVKKIFG